MSRDDKSLYRKVMEDRFKRALIRERINNNSFGPSFDRPEELAELAFGPAMDKIADMIKQELIDEAKQLQKKYKELGVNECYCAQSSAAECPAHIDTYICSLEWCSGNAPSDDNIILRNNKGR